MSAETERVTHIATLATFAVLATVVGGLFWLEGRPLLEVSLAVLFTLWVCALVAGVAGE